MYVVKPVVGKECNRGRNECGMSGPANSIEMKVKRRKENEDVEQANEQEHRRDVPNALICESTMPSEHATYGVLTSIRKIDIRELLQHSSLRYVTTDQLRLLKRISRSQITGHGGSPEEVAQASARSHTPLRWCWQGVESQF